MLITNSKNDMTQALSITFATLAVGTVINYTNCVVADNSDYIVIGHHADRWGNWTDVLQVTEFGQKIEVYAKTEFPAHTKIDGNRWNVISID